VGNIFSVVRVVGRQKLIRTVWQVLQKRQSLTINKMTNQPQYLQYGRYHLNLTLTQGVFVGAVSDNFDEREQNKIFHSEIVVDNEKSSFKKQNL
jgi:hypothetical protein